ncbi:MAG: class F sortase [Thermomicrobium sp.]|nr:class F sortase [Thermomicrobium sp.]
MRRVGILLVLAAASWTIGLGLGLLGSSTLGGLRREASPEARPERPAVGLSPRVSSPTPAPVTPVRGDAVDASPTPTAGIERIERIRIPAIGVDAPVVTKGLDPTRRMEAPDRPDEVAWYEFTALPGQGSNIVLAGHVDFVGVGPAVFWDLWRLRVGDVVELLLVDGRVVRYRVSGLETVVEAEAPVERIVGPTVSERVTLITCAGNYNPATGRYDQRLIVVALPIESARD